METPARETNDPFGCWLADVLRREGVETDGMRFEAIPFAPRGDLAAVRATDANSAVVTRADGRRYRTTDRGATWSVVGP